MSTMVLIGLFAPPPPAPLTPIYLINGTQINHTDIVIDSYYFNAGVVDDVFGMFDGGLLVEYIDNKVDKNIIKFNNVNCENYSHLVIDYRMFFFTEEGCPNTEIEINNNILTTTTTFDSIEYIEDITLYTNNCHSVCEISNNGIVDITLIFNYIPTYPDSFAVVITKMYLE